MSRSILVPPFPVFRWAVGVGCIGHLKIGPISKNSFIVSPGILETCLTSQIPGTSFKRKKMKTRKSPNGSLWVFSESRSGWIHSTGEEVDPGELLSKLTGDEMVEHKDFSFSEAFAQVQKKYPEIAERFREEVANRSPRFKKNILR